MSHPLFSSPSPSFPSPLPPPPPLLQVKAKYVIEFVSLGANLKTLSDGLSELRHEEGLKALDEALLEFCVFKDKLKSSKNWLRPVLEELVGMGGDGEKVPRRLGLEELVGMAGDGERSSGSGHVEESAKKEKEEEKTGFVVAADLEMRKFSDQNSNFSDARNAERDEVPSEALNSFEKRPMRSFPSSTPLEPLFLPQTTEASDPSSQSTFIGSASSYPLPSAIETLTAEASAIQTHVSLLEDSLENPVLRSQTMSSMEDLAWQTQIVDSTVQTGCQSISPLEDSALRARIVSSILDFQSEYPRRLKRAALRRCAEMLQQLTNEQQADILATITIKSNLKHRSVGRESISGRNCGIATLIA